MNKKPPFQKNHADLPKPAEAGVSDLAFHYWNSVSYLVRLIKAAELKAGLILSFYGILMNFVYQNAERTTDALGDYYLYYVLASIWIGLTGTSIYYSVRSFIPRIEANYDPNMFFFGDIISKYGSINEFSEMFYLKSLDEKDRYEQLGQQVFINAKITAVKMGSVNKSLKFLAYSLVALFSIIITFLIFTFINH
ncbi:MAG: Pycsar system effector family protein [Nonlabens sp.]